MDIIEQLPPPNSQRVNVYMPYYTGNKRTWLPKAMSLYEKGVLEGNRKIEGGENIPFVATWSVAALPADLTRCRLQFDGNAELSYEMTLANNEFVNFLIEVIMNFKSSRTIDFSKSFYRRLLRLDE
ncbi:type IV pilus biogenesis protein EbsA [Floridanema evergladense]|uniref:Type IV pilus biogenesis protein EbsA n=1 Tax=Floridaenema evergladense BLCC-F167 TaxID=3153639 RepID=A0ABV4WWN5_9CYAN